MERQVVEADGLAEYDWTSVSDAPQSRTSGIRCSLPFAKGLMCGNPRHREERTPDSEVIAGGGGSHDVWFVRSGILRLQRFSYDGRRQILSLFLRGEFVGIESEFREGLSVETVSQSSLCRIDRRKFDKMLAENDLLRAELFRQKQSQLDRLHWLTWSLGALGPEERLCAFLALSSTFMPYQPLPDGSAVLSVLLPRKDIADLLATTVESICRIVHRLSEAGIIEIRDPAHFRIVDLEKLIAHGQIGGHFDRMRCGIAGQSRRAAEITVPDTKARVCYCGR